MSISSTFLHGESAFTFLTKYLTPEEQEELAKANFYLKGQQHNVIDVILTVDEARQSPATILQTAFIWDMSPQGHEYWDRIARRLEGKE